LQKAQAISKVFLFLSYEGEGEWEGEWIREKKRNVTV
jgi:hypothetical protein